MSGNRSLDEFAGAGVDEGADDGADGGVGEAAAVEPANGDDAPPSGADSVAEPAPEVADAGADAEELDPPASTYVWSPEGGTCAGCGETVEERWRDGDDLVCAECKEW